MIDKCHLVVQIQTKSEVSKVFLIWHNTRYAKNEEDKSTKY